MGENFPFRTHFFYPPKLGEKWGRKNGVKCILHKYPLTYPSLYSWPDDFCLFSYLLLYLLTAQQRPGSLLSPLFFPPFFYVTWSSWYILLVEWCVAQTHSWLPNCWPRWMVTKSFAHKSLLNSSLLTMFLWAEYTKQFADHVFAGYKSFCPIKFICTLL